MKKSLATLVVMSSVLHYMRRLLQNDWTLIHAGGFFVFVLATTGKQRADMI